MSNIGRMRHRISLQSYSEMQDSTFQTVPTWTTITTFWGEVVATKGRVYFNGQQTDEVITHKITMRYQNSNVPITTELWLLFRNRRFRIRRVKDILERNRFLELMCEEVFLAQSNFTSGSGTANEPLNQPIENSP